MDRLVRQPTVFENPAITIEFLSEYVDGLTETDIDLLEAAMVDPGTLTSTDQVGLTFLLAYLMRAQNVVFVTRTFVAAQALADDLVPSNDQALGGYMERIGMVDENVRRQTWAPCFRLARSPLKGTWGTLVYFVTPGRFANVPVEPDLVVLVDTGHLISSTMINGSPRAVFDLRG